MKFLSFFFKKQNLRTVLQWSLIGILGIYFGYAYPAPQLYLSIEEIFIKDQSVHDEISLAHVNRSINRGFTGSFLVTVYREDDDESSWNTYCVGGEKLKYSTDSKLKKPIPLSWWIGLTSNADCANSILKEGVYYINTCWYIERPLAFTINTCKKSNIFEVYEDFDE